jgi:hypothetical protein
MVILMLFYAAPGEEIGGGLRLRCNCSITSWIVALVPQPLL